MIYGIDEIWKAFHKTFSKEEVHMGYLDPDENEKLLSEYWDDFVENLDA